MGGQEVGVGEYLNVRFPLLSFIIVIFDTGLSRVSPKQIINISKVL